MLSIATPHLGQNITNERKSTIYLQDFFTEPNIFYFLVKRVSAKLTTFGMCDHIKKKKKFWKVININRDWSELKCWAT